MKKKPIFATLLLVCFVLTFTLAGSLFASRADTGELLPVEHDHSLPNGVVFEDAAAAWDTDVAILAAESGLPVEQVEKAMEAQHEFAAYAEDLLSRYPDQISNVWMEPLPGTQGHIQFVGRVPAEVARRLDKNGQNEIAVVRGDGMISLNDQYTRAELAADILLDLGYNNSVTFFDQMAGVIQVEVKLPETAEQQPTVAELVNALQNQVQSNELQGQAAVFTANDLNLTVIIGDGPIAELAHSRGGEWTLKNGSNHCTSGWSVYGPNGDGIMTAGHCSANQFRESGCCVYGMTLWREVFGSGGDVEYLTTTHIELAAFYANSSTIRNVTGTRSTGSMVGNTVCKYGRSSNQRTCNHTVEAINVIVNYPQGQVRQLARTNNDSLIGGDSGGGWSWNNTAWGVTSGHGGGKSYYTPVRVGESSLGVTVMR